MQTMDGILKPRLLELQIALALAPLCIVVKSLLSLFFQNELGVNDKTIIFLASPASALRVL
jgi:uncharacterized BrkB/YihY/UPF0761 family membrane protein